MSDAPDRRHLLRDRRYRRLWTANFIATCAVWAHLVVVQWVLAQQGAGPATIAAAHTALTLAAVLALVPAGAWGDSADRRHVLATGGVAGIVAGACLTGSLMLGEVSAVALLSTVALLGLARGVVLPVWQSLQPQMVGADRVVQASLLSVVSINLSRAVGPAVAGAALVVAGASTVAALNLALLLGTTLVLARVPKPPTTRTVPARRFRPALVAGGHYVAGHRPLRGLLMRLLTFVSAGTILWALLPLVARDRLDVSAGGYGLLMASAGVGALVGAVGMEALRERLDNDKTVIAGHLAMGLGLLGLAWSQQFWIAAALVMCAGVGWIVAVGQMLGEVQLLLTDEVRTSGSSYASLALQGGQALGALGWGLVAATTTLSVSLVCAATLVLLAVGRMLWRSFRQRRAPARAGSHRAPRRLSRPRAEAKRHRA